MKLRNYQKQDYKQLKEEWSTQDHILFGAATGYGKSAIIFKVVKDVLKKDGRVLVILPRRKLVKQITNTLQSFYPSIVMGSDKRFDPTLNVHVASTATLHRRMNTHDLGKFDVIIIDEVHINFSSKSMESVVKKYWNTSRWLGLSATPIDDRGYRLEGWDHTIYNHQTQKLIKLGWLVPTEVLVEDRPKDLDSVSMIGGDYKESELESLMMDGGRVSNIYQIWKKYSSKRKTMIFAVSIAHAEMIRKDFEKKGVSCAIAHSNISEDDEEFQLNQFKENELRVLINVSKLITGYDEPSIDSLIIARPTKSLRLFMQIIGRGLRLSKGKKDCMVLDVAGVIDEHGYPTMNRDFNRVRPPKGKSTAPQYADMTCEKCDYVFQVINCRRSIKETKKYTRTRYYCPNCDAIVKENVVDNKEVKRMRKIENITDTSKVTGKKIAKFIDRIRWSNNYKSGWYMHIKRRYENNPDYAEQIKILYNKWKLDMVNDKTVATNINKLNKDYE